jgi:hypothetical protein
VKIANRKLQKKPKKNGLSGQTVISQILNHSAPPEIGRPGKI